MWGVFLLQPHHAKLLPARDKLRNRDRQPTIASCSPKSLLSRSGTLPGHFGGHRLYLSFVAFFGPGFCFLRTRLRDLSILSTRTPSQATGERNTAVRRLPPCATWCGMPVRRLLPVLPCADFYHMRACLSTTKGVSRLREEDAPETVTAIKLCVPRKGPRTAKRLP
jgi:hypothetical protein